MLLAPLKAQVIDVDASGNSILAYSGANATIDAARGYFGAGFINASNSKYFRTTPVWGMRVAGIERAGGSSLLKNGFTATGYKAGITLGISFSSEYKNKYKPKADYQKMLDDEKLVLQQYIAEYKKDTAVVYGFIKLISASYSSHIDSLKLLYKEYGLQKDLFAAWRAYAKRVETATNKKGFYIEVNDLIYRTAALSLYRDNVIFQKRLKKINQQLSTIDKAPQSFAQTILFFDGGVSGFAYNTATFKPFKGDSVPTFGKKSYGNPYVAFGLTHNQENKAVFGFRIGFDAVDNFEQLSQLQYDSSKAFNASKGKVNQTYIGYEGVYRRVLSPFFSFNISLIQNIDNVGNVVLTPLYGTFSNRSTFGAALTLITKSKISLGVNVESLTYRASDFPDIDNSYKGFSFGFRIGYTLADFNFAR